MLERVKVWYTLLPVVTTSKQIDVAHWTSAVPHILQQRVIIDSMRGQRKPTSVKLTNKTALCKKSTSCTHLHSHTLFPHFSKIVKIWSADRWWYLRRAWSVGGGQGCVSRVASTLESPSTTPIWAPITNLPSTNTGANTQMKYQWLLGNCFLVLG